MDVLLLVARILFSAVFLIVPAQVIASSAQVVKAPALRRLPAARASVVVASSVAIVSALLIVLGVWPDAGALLIAAYLVPVTAVMHAFWAFDDPAQVRQHRESFLLNTSILGGALVLFWAVNQLQVVPAGLVATPLLDRL